MSSPASNRTDLTGTGFLIGTAMGAASSGVLSVNIGGTVTDVQADRDQTFAAGDRVGIARYGSLWFTVGRYFAGGTPPDVDNSPPPDPKPGTVTGSKTFNPVETRSYRNGKWRTDNDRVYQGQYGGNGNHTGCAFYGTSPESLDGATVTYAAINVRRLKGGDYAAESTTMRLVTQSRKPSGAPTLTSSVSGPDIRVGATETFVLPDSWGQALVDGTAGGIGFFDSGGSPYVEFAGRQDWASAFTLTLRWSRTT